MVHPRYLGSYVYEEFINVDNGEPAHRWPLAYSQRRISKYTPLDPTSRTRRHVNPLSWMVWSDEMPMARRPASSASYPQRKSSTLAMSSMRSDKESAVSTCFDVRVETEAW